MRLRKIINKIHLVLGLASGIVVFIVSITGCLYVFQKEIQDFTQPYRFVEISGNEFLLPSQLKAAVEEETNGKFVSTIYYHEKNRSAIAILSNKDPFYYDAVFINPYTAEILSINDLTKDFFVVVQNLHTRLLLPAEIGEAIVGYSTLIFFLMMLSGIYLWWPRKRNAYKQRFSLRWNANLKRRNYDLHNVLGFYMMWIAIFIVFTGLMWSFKWISDPVYSLVTGGKEIVEYYVPNSDTTNVMTKHELSNEDIVWKKVMSEEKDVLHSGVFFPNPQKPESPIMIYTNPSNDTYYQREFKYFNQYTLEELPANHYWADYDKANAGEMIERMLYDIHVGAILGLPGKILAFGGSLIAASLPITGFLIWRGKRRKI
ncbi:MAG: PepSY domain-containing protein [Melioribacteraceae bacterium]|nr:PepSY domain-containing protein [Melioribacteraceae bacterium]